MQSRQIQVQLTEEELLDLKRILGRNPSDLELAMVDAEWSEHCSYKSSKLLLKQLPVSGKRVLIGPGFDAGVLDIGDDYVLTVHIESHNHPSAIDPYGGAATGVGGVLRDILCMGTRPIALLDSLRFGPITISSHSRWIFKNVVRGIGDYGNCVGVPTIGGEVEFDECFESNCLVDVVCLGVGRRTDLVLAEAKYPGDSVILVGGRTGRDGIRGASFASRVLTDKSEGDRSAVQIPDPFTKKMIIEASLEVLATGHVRGLKDLGGGGLTCGLSEMADKGGCGIEIDLAKIPVRETGMAPAEVMISESQERMIFIVEHGREEEVGDIFQKYELPYAAIGTVIEEGNLLVKSDGDELANLPASAVANAPAIQRQVAKPEYIDRLREAPKPPIPENLSLTMLSLLSSPNISSKKWVYEQYDHEVGLLTVVKPGEADASVLRLPNGRFLAVKTDGNSRQSYLDPYNGASGCLAEACRNVLGVGGTPIAMLDHLQFGDPGNPEVFWTFNESVKGLADYCRFLDLPCVGGKVSFYNEDQATGSAIKPTPVVVVLGLIEKYENIKTSSLTEKSDKIVMIGRTKDEMGGSEYYEYVHHLTGGKAPKVDFNEERKLRGTLESVVNMNLVNSIHDCSAGGLAISLAEMCIQGHVGADVDLREVSSECSRMDDLLFSESHGRFIFGVSEKNLDTLLALSKRMGIECRCIGSVNRSEIIFRSGDTEVLSLDLDRMKTAWFESIPRCMGEVF